MEILVKWQIFVKNPNEKWQFIDNNLDFKVKPYNLNKIFSFRLIYYNKLK